MSSIKHNQKGFAALFITILILMVVFGIVVSITLLTTGQQKIARNIIKSSQAYYIAEAGVEDALLRLVKDMNRTSTSTLNVGDGSATIEISDIIGGSRTITSKGDVLNRIRKVVAVYEVITEKTSFYYVACVGEGGIIMDDKSQIDGNIFSNGNINAGPTTKITGTVKVAQTGNYIDGAKIGEDACVDICKNSEIGGTLTCAASTNCTATNYTPLLEEIATSNLPISQEQIDQWKVEAASGGTIPDYILSGDIKSPLGPKKIEGNMTIQDKAELSITGTIWATGDITIQDEAKVHLDRDNYGSNSGVIISDGKITLQDNSKTSGSGEIGSYIMLISTAPGAQAIIIKNTADTDILFAQNGWIVIQDSAKLREISGYGIHLKNSVKVTYEVGLQDISFTSGPRGSWEITSWKETE